MSKSKILTLLSAAAATNIASSSQTNSGTPFVATTSPRAFLDVRGGQVPPTNEDSDPKSKRRRKKKSRERATTGSKDETSSRAKEEQKKDTASDQTKQEKTTPRNTPKTNPILEEIVNETDYYKILGVSRTANEAAIKKAYRRKAVTTHPDKTNGDRRAFDKVAEAYDVLSDSSKRPIYDRYGKAGLDSTNAGGGMHQGAEDLFRSFFGGSPFGQPPAPRNRTTRYQLAVSLEELYKGVSQDIWIQAEQTLRPNSSSSSKRKQVHVSIPRGACHGQAIVLSGEVDFEASDTPADLVFLIQERPHAVFTRKGYDLAIRVPIRLKEAVCGVRRTIRHLDGRHMTIRSASEKDGSTVVIQNGDVQRLVGQGMPKNAQGTEFGDLYVQFEVTMPTKTAARAEGLTDDERVELGRLLDKLEGVKKDANAAHLDEQSGDRLQKASLTDFGVASGIPHIPTYQEEEQDDGFSRFGNGQFFYSSRRGGTHPFFGMHQQEFHQEEPECRQM